MLETTVAYIYLRLFLLTTNVCEKITKAVHALEDRRNAVSSEHF